MSAAAPSGGRDETRLERIDRNLAELTGELRVVVTGVQVLFAFLLVVPFDSGFARAGSFVRYSYLASLALAGLAAACMIAPAAQHRVLFRQSDKPHLVEVANRIALAGLAALALAMCGSLLVAVTTVFDRPSGVAVAAAGLVTFAALWFAMPLARARRRRGPASVPSIDWDGAAVTAGTLEVELTDVPGRAWARRFHEAMTAPDGAAAGWGAVELRGRRIRVGEVREGAEERLRRLLDGASLQAGGSDAALAERDRRMSDAFRRR